MKIAIAGDGTLAQAVRECCKDIHEVVALPDDSVEVLWVCYDITLFNDFRPDVERLLNLLIEDLENLHAGAIVLISSPLPVGSTRFLQRKFQQFKFAYSPENVRAATAVEDFMNPGRIVVGVRDRSCQEKLTVLLNPFSDHLIFTDLETAEMAKHALNGFLALNIAYINEIADICKRVGADPDVLSKCLRTDPRISQTAPLLPGPPYGGGHLEREIWNLCHLGEGLELPIIENIQASNERTR